MEETKRATIYRFHEFVAMHTPDTPTQYLPAALARKMGAELLRYADDIGARKFTASGLGTVYLDGAENIETDSSAAAGKSERADADRYLLSDQTDAGLRMLADDGNKAADAELDRRDQNPDVDCHGQRRS